jgi:mannosyltransferase
MIVIDGIIFSLQRTGGISVIFQSLLNYLDSQVIPTTLLLNESAAHDVSKYSGNLSIQKQQRRLLERYRPCKTPDCSVFHSSYYRLPHKPNVATVVSVYDFMYERYRRGPAQWVHILQKHAAIRRARSIVCISHSTCSDLLEYVGVREDQTVHVIHLGASEEFKVLDQNSPSHFETKNSGKPFLLFIGLRGGYKNFRLALRALELLPDFELWCVGGGEFKPKEFDGISMQIVNRTRHLGFIENKNLNQLYNHAAALIYPSSYEGFGLPVLEAMRAGCPVISIDCKAIIEIGGDALLVSADGDPSEIALLVQKAVSSKRSEIKSNGLKNAALYSTLKTNEKIMEVYKKLVTI